MIFSALLFECLDSVGELPASEIVAAVDPMGRAGIVVMTEYQYGLLVDALRDSSHRKRSVGLAGVANDLDNLREIIANTREITRG